MRALLQGLLQGPNLARWTRRPLLYHHPPPTPVVFHRARKGPGLHLRGRSRGNRLGKVPFGLKVAFVFIINFPPNEEGGSENELPPQPPSPGCLPGTDGAAAWPELGWGKSAVQHSVAPSRLPMPPSCPPVPVGSCSPLSLWRNLGRWPAAVMQPNWQWTGCSGSGSSLPELKRSLRQG